MGRIKGSEVSIEKKFWKKVQKTDDCWIWTACGSGPDGKYGGIMIRHKKQKAHRVSYEIHFGAIPKGMYVCHSCDNPKCVRPDHLFLGTAKQNTQDCISKRRMHFQIKPDFMANLRGSQNPKSKLTERVVLEMRNRRKLGESLRGLAREAGVCHKTLLSAIHGKTWSHV